MFQLIAMHMIFLLSVVTIVVAGVSLLRGKQIADLRMGTRNVIYIGACCAMTVGVFGAVACVGSVVVMPWHYPVAVVLGGIALFATIHIIVDFGDRLEA